MVVKTNLKPNIFQVANKYKIVLEKAGVKVSGLYVFGSQVKGTAKEWSDIDIGVVSPDFSGKPTNNRERLMDYSHKVNDFIEPHPFTPEEFEDKYYFLAQEVKKTGIKI